MKKISACLAMLLMAIALPQISSAQFMKSLMNNVKQNLTNKQSGNKSDSTAGKGYDSTMMKQLMANMNNNKPQVSPADSAAAIQSFKTGSGGTGLQYKYHITYDWKIKGKDSITQDTSTTSITNAPISSCSEIGMLGAKVHIIVHAANPKYSMWVYQQNKKYSLMIVDTANINSHDHMNYQVTKVGNETINGYSCIHSKLTITNNIGKANPITEEIWTSSDIPGYANLKKLMTMQQVTPKMIQALDQAGCGGFFVKMTMQSPQISMTMVLIAAGPQNLPASLFEIPSGYTQASMGGFFGGMLSH